MVCTGSYLLPEHHFNIYKIFENLKTFKKEELMDKVLVILGSKSDFQYMMGTVETLEEFGIDYSIRMASAHRVPNKLDEILEEEFEDNRCKVIIAAAGMAAHLPGVIASKKPLVPVIGVPMASSKLNGIDALLSIVQMPSSVPVATVAIGGAVNAAILAVQMLALRDESLYGKLSMLRVQIEAKIDEYDNDMISFRTARKSLDSKK